MKTIINISNKEVTGCHDTNEYPFVLCEFEKNKKKCSVIFFVTDIGNIVEFNPLNGRPHIVNEIVSCGYYVWEDFFRNKGLHYKPIKYYDNNSSVTFDLDGDFDET